MGSQARQHWLLHIKVYTTLPIYVWMFHGIGSLKYASAGQDPYDHEAHDQVCGCIEKQI